QSGVRLYGFDGSAGGSTQRAELYDSGNGNPGANTQLLVSTAFNSTSAGRVQMRVNNGTVNDGFGVETGGAVTTGNAELQQNEHLVLDLGTEVNNVTLTLGAASTTDAVQWFAYDSDGVRVND